VTLLPRAALAAVKTRIRKAAEADAQAICDIYNAYVLETTITFEQHAVAAPEMAERIRQVSEEYPWLVADSDLGLLAYAYATRWRSRAAYDRTAESTIYVRSDATGSGIGFPLYLALLEELRARSVHAVVGCIALPNPGSVAFHEKCGFRKVAHFPEVGRKFDRWVDVGFWQLLL
jgi:phosphinothricin acetyltransferase